MRARVHARGTCICINSGIQQKKSRPLATTFAPDLTLQCQKLLALTDAQAILSCPDDVLHSATDRSHVLINHGSSRVQTTQVFFQKCCQTFSKKKTRLTSISYPPM